MAKPTKTAAWATNPNYPAGSEPWAGTPTKVEPDAGELAAGHTPGIIDPAEKENWWKNLVGQWTAWLNGLVDALGNLTLDEDASVTVSGDGQYRHPKRTITIPLLPITDANVAPDEKTTLTAGNFKHIPIPPLPTGKRLLGARAVVTDSAAGPTTVNLSFRRHDNAGGGTTFAAGAASAGTGASQSIATVSPIGTGFEYVEAGYVYGVQVAYSSGAANVTIRGVEVDYDEPEPA